MCRLCFKILYTTTFENNQKVNVKMPDRYGQWVVTGVARMGAAVQKRQSWNYRRRHHTPKNKPLSNENRV